VRLDDDTGTATVIVSDYQLSLAIGKEGQNARLAARLTGWRIDIKSETQLAEEESGYAGEEWAEGEWIQNEAGEMVWQPAEGGTAVSATEWSQGAEGAGTAAPEAAGPEAAGPEGAEAAAPEADGSGSDGAPVDPEVAAPADEPVTPDVAAVGGAVGDRAEEVT
jgi:N utilization substance protein A